MRLFSSVFLAAIVVGTLPALAGKPMPLPAAGLSGPLGIAAVVIGYGAYRLFRSKK